jgi:hypothetical protein
MHLGSLAGSYTYAPRPADRTTLNTSSGSMPFRIAHESSSDLRRLGRCLEIVEWFVAGSAEPPMRRGPPCPLGAGAPCELGDRKQRLLALTPAPVLPRQHRSPETDNRLWQDGEGARDRATKYDAGMHLLPCQVRGIVCSESI